MRTLVGKILARAYSAREDRGVKRMQAGRFQDYEHMGLWIRYGMDHDQFESFTDACRMRAIARYSRYLAFIHFAFGIELQANNDLSDWYYWTAFYAAVVRRAVKRTCSDSTRPR